MSFGARVYTTNSGEASPAADRETGGRLDDTGRAQYALWFSIYGYNSHVYIRLFPLSMALFDDFCNETNAGFW